ncbi:MAG: alpha-amylase family glycosyl hydrolase [Trueperaceae bacterium]
MRAFHVALEARRRYDVDAAWVTLRGDLMLADPDRAARVAARVALDPDPEAPALRAADLYAGALLEEVFHLVIARYLQTVDAGLFADLERRARAWMGADFDATLVAFVERYPPPDVAAGTAAEAALRRSVDGVSGAHVAIEEAWTCWLANANPALEGARPLVDVAPLAARVPFEALIGSVRGHLADRPGLPGRPGVSLFDFLLEPARAHPDDLEAQLQYVYRAWGSVLGDDFRRLLARLLDALASVREANVARGGGVGRPPAPGRADLRSGEDEAERFSPDGDWMPKVVMVAKSTYVWLEQLARDYGGAVARLDEVPDAALAEFARKGVNALWLIGVWQRSEASRRIKHLRGQHDAVASAYALEDYVIAHDLGGEPAFEALKTRAARHGIRMATDMVPNHVGIDGRWVVEHPERFVQLPHPPYPGYTFTGPDLSGDPRVEIRIEDHYYDGSDAAVVFERRDTATGEVRYVYHGNDGTTMPWNDTAQLDYLRADVREAVVRTIVEVARRSPIIRFDAAMTLAKRHVRRLWFPPPGEGGGVPSRGRFGAMTDEEFEAAVGGEFWRTVVERVAAEVPDTLLLAEAFWMMESYFVRSLGMHRVYNSAFMHMMRDEDNAGYRRILKELLEFDPRVLQRYVNFMNNPDEESARDQFGDGDRYFAVVTLLATMPGLPMIGHGQFEGYREKYGMEFRRAKRDERPEGWLLERHDRELVPVLRHRAAFAGAEAFRLYDAVADDGAVLEDVYAYTNDAGGGRSLVIVNHRYPRSTGTVERSTPFVPQAGAAARTVSVAEALGLAGGEGRFVLARDLARGVTVVRAADEVVRGGWRFDLEGFGRRVYVDLHERHDPDGSLARIAATHGDAGVASLDDALDELRWGPAYAALDAAVAAWLAGTPMAEAWTTFVDVVEQRAGAAAHVPAPTTASRSRQRTAAAASPEGAVAAAYAFLIGHLPDAPGTWRRGRFGRALERRLARSGVADAAAWAAAAHAALAAATGAGRPTTAATTIDRWCGEAAALAALGVHEHAGVRWLRAEGLETLADVAVVVGRWRSPGAGNASAWRAWRRSLDASVRAAGFDVDAWCAAARTAVGARGGSMARSRARIGEERAIVTGAIKTRATAKRATKTRATGKRATEKRATEKRATEKRATKSRAAKTPKR